MWICAECIGCATRSLPRGNRCQGRRARRSGRTGPWLCPCFAAAAVRCGARPGTLLSYLASRLSSMNTYLTLLTGGGLTAAGVVASGLLANWLGSRRDWCFSVCRGMPFCPCYFRVDLRPGPGLVLLLCWRHRPAPTARRPAASASGAVACLHPAASEPAELRPDQGGADNGMAHIQ